MGTQPATSIPARKRGPKLSRISVLLKEFAARWPFFFLTLIILDFALGILAVCLVRPVDYALGRLSVMGAAGVLPFIVVFLLIPRGAFAVRARRALIGAAFITLAAPSIGSILLLANRTFD